MPPEERLTIHIRLPSTLLRQIKVAAAGGGRSINAEISARLERSFGPEDEGRRAAAKLLAEALSILDKGTNG